MQVLSGNYFSNFVVVVVIVVVVVVIFVFALWFHFQFQFSISFFFHSTHGIVVDQFSPPEVVFLHIR